MEDWSKALQDGNPIDAIYLDFSKAFDKVSHKRLLTKIESYGIHGEVLGWIANFLDGRKQMVSVDGVLSDLAPVRSGIPQGSVLGPTLFVIFVTSADLYTGR